MKKRTKITLRTKIYLTIVLLLALTGVFYASNPTFFTSVPFATGVAASQTDLLVSEYFTDNIDRVACDGTVSLLATIPGFGSCRKKYLTIATWLSATAAFTPRYVLVDEGASAVHAIKNDGTVTLNILSHVAAEGVFVIPSVPCTFCSGGAFFQALQDVGQVWQYPLSDFTGLGGKVLVTSESGPAGA